LRVSGTQAVSYRLSVNNLARRLPAHSYVEAAYVGLQDTAPRDALLGLHARVEDCEPSAWEHSRLIQTYSPRRAVYVLPKDDFGIFTIGHLPRDPAARQSRIGPSVCAQTWPARGDQPPGCQAIVTSVRLAGSRSAGLPAPCMAGSNLARRSTPRRLGSSSAAATATPLVRPRRRHSRGGPACHRGMLRIASG
jgi:hypothetical protein